MIVQFFIVLVQQSGGTADETTIDKDNEKSLTLDSEEYSPQETGSFFANNNITSKDTLHEGSSLKSCLNILD